ncbi:hypothetical protein GCM10010452_68470 [Crossiella cryophila]
MHPDVRTGYDPTLSQVVGESVGPRLQFRVADLTPTADHGDALGDEIDGMFDEIRDVDGHASKVERVIVVRQ